MNLVDAAKPLVGILGAGDDETHIPEKRRADYVSEEILRKPLVDRRPGCIPRLVVSVQAEPNEKVPTSTSTSGALSMAVRRSAGSLSCPASLPKPNSRDIETPLP